MKTTSRLKDTSIGLLLLSIFSVIPVFHVNAQSADKLPVKSYALQKDVQAFNAELAAREPNEPWQNQALAVALRYLKDTSGTRLTRITSQVPAGEDPEEPSLVIITVVQDGFLDDSVRGEWNQLILKKDHKERWMLQSARKAFLCHRGSTQAFQKELCP